MSALLKKITFALGFVNLATTSKKTGHNYYIKDCGEKKFLNMQECSLHWVFLASANWEIVIEHKLAKDR